VARWIAPAALGLCLALASGAAAAPATWRSAVAAPGVVDVAGPRTDDTLVAAVGGGIEAFNGRSLSPFTHPSAPGAYAPSAGESYLAVTPDVRVPKSDCSFHRNDVFALGDNPDRVVRITRRGNASSFVSLPSPFLAAIAFDRVGTFGHRLLVAGTANDETTLYAIDCRGRVKVLTRHGPLVEGGMEVAPRGFGRFGGRLFAADELHGPVYAFKRSGAAVTVARPSLATGGDIGVEALGFVPRLVKHAAAFLADRGVPGSPHPGTDSILRLTAAQLRSAGVHAGDLLVATEGGADTVAIRCRKQRKRCGVHLVAHGPVVAHAEGHIAFIR
jgi:hypothetical protein